MDDILDEIKNKIGGNGNVLLSVLAKVWERLTQMLSETTENNAQDIKAKSVLETDKYFKPYLDNLEPLKKSLKRKFVKELLEYSKTIAECTKSIANAENIRERERE